MRRSSLITIILLVLIIIGLSVALVLTNLPQKESEVLQTTTQANENVENKTDKKIETPTSLSLSNEKAVEIQNMINKLSHRNLLFENRKGKIDSSEIDDARKITMAYVCYYIGSKGDTHFISKGEIDEGMKKLFGNSDYNPEAINNGGNYLYYVAEKDGFNIIFNGGGPQTSVRSGIYKIDEYSDRYEVYTKNLVEVPEYSTFNIANDALRFEVRADNSMFSKYLGQYYSTIPDGYSFENFEEFTKDVQLKDFVEGSNDKLLSKFYDEASEYKVTFMKNDDGSFYWLKTEVIK